MNTANKAILNTVLLFRKTSVIAAAPLNLINSPAFRALAASGSAYIAATAL